MEHEMKYVETYLHFQLIYQFIKLKESAYLRATFY